MIQRDVRSAADGADAALREQFAQTRFQLLEVELLTVRGMQPTERREREFLDYPHELLLVPTEAEGRLIIDGQYRSLHAGAVYVCGPGRLIEIGVPAGGETALYAVHFQSVPASGETPRKPAALPALSDVLLGDELSLLPAMSAGKACETMYRCWQSGGIAERLRCIAAFHELLAHMFDQQEQRTAVALECARLEVQRCYREELTVDRLAETAGLSRFHFMRLFKEKYGKGVVDYITELRLQEAKRLMAQESASPLRDIAYEIGYMNETYFSKLFKKQTGMAPAIYMKNRSRRIAAYSWVNFGQLLALNTIPFAAPVDHYWTDDYRDRFAYEVRVPLSHHYDFNREALEKAQPDGIVAINSLIGEEEQAKLRRIAPTLFLPWQQDWRTHLRLLGAFLQKEVEAERWLVRYARQTSLLRQRLQPRIGDDTVLVLIVWREQLLVWGSRAATVLYDDLELQAPRGVQDIDWTAAVNGEQLATYEADRIVLQVYADPLSQATWRELAASESWRQLPAVRRGAVHQTEALVWAEAPWNEYSAYTCGKLTEQLGSLLG